MDKFYLEKVTWRLFDPHNYHQTLISGINIPFTIRHSNDYFEDELAQDVREVSGLKKVWRVPRRKHNLYKERDN